MSDRSLRFLDRKVTDMPVDWVSLAAVVMGTLIVLIPVAGITLRFALKPVTEAVLAFKASQGRERQIDILEKRVTYLEQQNENLESEMRRIGRVVEFHEKLEAPDE